MSPEALQRRDRIRDSDIPTSRLAALALTLPVIHGENDLGGRPHAFYSIAHNQADAIESILTEPDEFNRRVCAVRALVRAGYDLPALKEVK